MARRVWCCAGDEISMRIGVRGRPISPVLVLFVISTPQSAIPGSAAHSKKKDFDPLRRDLGRANLGNSTGYPSGDSGQGFYTAHGPDANAAEHMKRGGVLEPGSDAKRAAPGACVIPPPHPPGYLPAMGGKRRAGSMHAAAPWEDGTTELAHRRLTSGNSAKAARSRDSAPRCDLPLFKGSPD